MTHEPDRTGIDRRALGPDTADLTGDAATVRNATEVRQAAPAGRVRWVLLLGIVFVVIAFIAAYLGTRP